MYVDTKINTIHHSCYSPEDLAVHLNLDPLNQEHLRLNQKRHRYKQKIENVTPKNTHIII